MNRREQLRCAMSDAVEIARGIAEDEGLSDEELRELLTEKLEDALADEPDTIDEGVPGE